MAEFVPEDEFGSEVDFGSIVEFGSMVDFGSNVDPKTGPSARVCRLNFALVLWISMTFVCSSYPVDPSMSNNPFYLNCQLAGKADYCLLLSFRNGVGSGVKKTSSRRARS
ncbi:PREDICTED: neuropeptide S-like [Acanthisitta chloris]|uniref:neuropeptide S-like n=1 Tax=Acanthisitta chloris TaxID=57068 RepID=UPI0004F0EEA8|nr:PREDICTED: neuropeptide S-like [Acanthisitta chloris]